MKTVFSLSDLIPVQTILEEKEILFTKVGDYVETTVANSKFLTEFLEIPCIILNENNEVTA